MRVITFTFAILSVLWMGTAASATGVSSSGVLVTTHYAVPVGVPVAPYAPTYYSLQTNNQAAATSQLSTAQEEKLVNKIAERVAQRLAAQQGLATQQGAVPQSKNLAQQNIKNAQAILQKRCANCHSQSDPQGGLDLEKSFSDFSRKTRQKAILRMLSSDPTRRMPKGQPPLSESEFLALFNEMVQ